ncbi:hypothetical protein R3P38DRAFT_2768545 [Favolaschia claudopus]|uniref:Uncharacterized protein n=1 Tax=Favolaschia claudopus TaxID=2862362 RepID=A0AAW0CMS1_9AGAR
MHWPLRSGRSYSVVRLNGEGGVDGDYFLSSHPLTADSKTMSIARSRLLCQSVRNQGIGDFLIGDPAATGELFASEQILRICERIRRKMRSNGNGQDHARGSVTAVCRRVCLSPLSVFSGQSLLSSSHVYRAKSDRVKAHEKSRRKEANIAAALAEYERNTMTLSRRVQGGQIHARVRGSRLPPHPNEIKEGKRAKEAGKEKKRVERERRKELRAEIEQEWAEMKHQHNAAVENWTSKLQETGLRKKDLPPKPKLGKKPKLPVMEDEDEDEEDEPNEKGDV